MGLVLVVDSEWIYNRTGEIVRVLYWENGKVFFRKVRGTDGLVGPTFQLDYKQFSIAYSYNFHRKSFARTIGS